MTKAMQMSLPLVPRLRYDGSQFVLHKGVAELFQLLLSDSWVTDSNRCFWIYGEKTTGKTHLCLRLIDELSQREISAHFVDGSDLKRWIAVADISKDEWLIVDNTELYFAAVESSGGFVNLCEQAKHKRFRIVLLLGKTPQELNVDEHIASRLRGGVSAAIGHPGADDLESLVRAVGVQYGYRISAGRVKFIARRLSSTVADVVDYYLRVRHLSTVLGKKVTPSLLSDAV